MTFKALSLDYDTHDLTITNNSFVLVANASATAQRIKQHLRFFLGEWFLDTSKGVPWFEYVFVVPFDQATAEAVIKDAVMQVPGVTAITAFGATFYPGRREFRVSQLSVQTEFDGVITVNV